MVLRSAAQEEAPESAVRNGDDPSKKCANRVFAPFGSGQQPRIRCLWRHKRALFAIVRRAGHVNKRYESPLEEILNHNDVRTVADEAVEAVQRLVYLKVYSTPTAEFRAMIRSERPGPLRKALETLEELLPDAGTPPPWDLLRAQYAGGDPFTDDLRRDGDITKGDDWDRRLHPVILRDGIREILKSMNELENKMSGTRPPEVPERMFVETLGHYWAVNLGLPLKNGRWPMDSTKQKNGCASIRIRSRGCAESGISQSPETSPPFDQALAELVQALVDDGALPRQAVRAVEQATGKNSRRRSQENEQRGPFADFVRKVAELYPEEQLRAEFPEERHADLRLASLDGHIRAVAEKSTLKAP